MQDANDNAIKADTIYIKGLINAFISSKLLMGYFLEINFQA